MSDMTDLDIDTPNLALDAGLSRMRSPRIRGAAGLAMSGASAASELALTGKISQSTALGTMAGGAAMIGARLIPGIGWAATAYTIADIGSRAYLGKPFGETMIGKPIDWAAGKVGRAGLSAATSVTEMVGWKGGSDFLQKTLHPWAFPDDRLDDASLSPAQRAERNIADARKSGLLPHEQASPVLMRGPKVAMDASDWHEHPPVKERPALAVHGATLDIANDKLGTTLTTIEPKGDDIALRQQNVMDRDSEAISKEIQTGKGSQIPIDAQPRKANDLLAAAATEMSRPAMPALQVASRAAGKPSVGVGLDD